MKLHLREERIEKIAIPHDKRPTCIQLQTWSASGIHKAIQGKVVSL